MREPGKEAYRELENDAELEFLFYLADRLGRTVGELSEMSHSEYVLWGRFHARRAQRRELAQKMAGG